MKLTTLFATMIAVAGLSAFAQESANTTTSPLPTPREVQQDSEFKPHIGAQLGMANPEGGFDTGSEIGLDIGFQPYIPYGLGVEFTQVRAESKGEGTSIDRSIVMAKATYNFGGDIAFIKHSYVGAGLGGVFYSGDSSLVLAPLLGFDIPLNQSADRRTGIVSAGALAKYSILEGSNANTLSVNGMLKYWF